MRRRSYSDPGHAHFVTFSCYQNLPIRENSWACEFLAQSLDSARIAEEFDLWAYVFMPDHVHLVICPQGFEYSISSMLRAIKEPCSRRIVSYLQAHDTDFLGRLLVRSGTREFHRVWQRGGGFDRNLITPEIVRRAIDYVEANPVRKSLVETPAAWRWSSARQRAGYADAVLGVDVCGALT